MGGLSSIIGSTRLVHFHIKQGTAVNGIPPQFQLAFFLVINFSYNAI
jgi:hypothetical protein